MYYDKDDFDGTPTASTTEAPQSDFAASCDQDTPATPLSKERPYKKGITLIRFVKVHRLYSGPIIQCLRNNKCQLAYINSNVGHKLMFL